MEKIEILRILDTYSNEDEAIKQRIANALLDLSNVVGRSEQLGDCNFCNNKAVKRDEDGFEFCAKCLEA